MGVRIRRRPDYKYGCAGLAAGVAGLQVWVSGLKAGVAGLQVWVS